MKRLIATIQADLRLQFRNGFHYVTAFVVVIWLLVFGQVGRTGLDLQWVLPAFVLDNLVINSFLFIGALVLLEKGEGTLQAQVVTPLLLGEYLGAKVITLTLLALLQNLAVVLVFHGLTPGVLPLVLGVALASTLYILAGFVVVVRYDSVNEYLLPAIACVALLLAPLLPYVNGWDSWLLRLHPMQAVLLILQSAFRPVDAGTLIYALLYSLLWVGLLYRTSRRAFDRFIIGRTGAN